MKKDKILIIEDEIELGNALKIILELKGFDVVVANRGKDGLDFAKSNSISLILCDVHLPDISGYDILKAIRIDESIQHIPLIFMTAFAEEHEMEEVGAPCLIKPFTSRDLIATVTKQLESKQPRTEPA